MSSWFDMMAAEEQRTLYMTPAEWKAESQRLLRTARGDVRHVVAYLRNVEAERAALAAAAASTPVTAEPVNRDLRVWRDMVEEPEKYGEDIAEWLELDAKLRAGPGRWRIEAYWLEKELEIQNAAVEAQARWRAIYSIAARQAAVAGENAWVMRDLKRHVARFRKAVATIQAAVRGYQARTRMNFRDCCMCLAHRICPLQTDVGMMCRACAEDGPHADLTGCDDPWDWFRGDYEDLAPVVAEEEDYTPEPRGVRDRLHEFPHKRRYESEWESHDKGTCLWCGTTFRRPYSGLFEGANEFGYCSDECDANRYCWKRMQWAGKKGPLDHEWLATYG